MIASHTAPADNPQAAAPWSELFRRSHLALLAILCLGVWLHAADALLVATLMPSAVADIGGVAYLSWTIALYELGSIVAGVATGVAIMRSGLRAVMVSAAAVYAVGCAMSALAPDMGIMLAGRVLQGIGGGMMLAGTFSGMNRLFPERLWIRVVAVISATWGTSSLVGPLIGGLFANFGLWRGGFWAFGAQAVLFGLAAWLLLKSGDADDRQEAAPVAWGNLALIALGVLAIAAAGAAVSPLWTPAACLAGIALLWLFVRRDQSHAGRMLTRRPLDLRHSSGAGTVMVLASAIATVAFFVYGPIVMQSLYGTAPLTAGYVIALESVAWSIAAIAVSGVRQDREPAVIVIGSILITASLIGLALTMPRGPLLAILPWAVFQGAGFGMAWGFVVRRAIAGARKDERDRISTLLPTVQMLGYAIGASAAGIVANVSGYASGVSVETSRQVAFWIFAAFVPLALIGNLAAWRVARA